MRVAPGVGLLTIVISACGGASTAVAPANPAASSPAQTPAPDPAPAPVSDVPLPSGWAFGTALPVTPLAAFIAQGRLWVIGTTFRNNLALSEVVSASLGADGVPRQWDVAAQAP